MSRVSGITRRKQRVRNRLRNRPVSLKRLSVFRSNKHICAQIIDDESRVTVVSASTLDSDLKKLKSTSNTDAATAVGKLIAERAKKAGLEKIVFDRGPYLYHGRVKALAEAARENGLIF